MGLKISGEMLSTSFLLSLFLWSLIIDLGRQSCGNELYPCSVFMRGTSPVH